MSGRGKILGLVALLAILVAVGFLDRRKRATGARLVNLGNVSVIELKVRGTSSLLKKSNGHWQLESYDGKPAVDTRVNVGLVTHLIDLAKVLRNDTKSPLNADDAPAYGMNKPELVMNMRWTEPSPGSEEVRFGHRDLSGRKVFAYFPDRKLLVETPASVVMLIEDREALDVRDRRITTFEVDDVEDLETSGKCGRFSLRRDGDRWLSGTRPIGVEAAESWLSRLLETRHDGVSSAGSAPDRPTENPVCDIRLAGRRSRSEQIRVFKAQGTLWAKNSALPAVYHLAPGFLSALVPPRP